MSDTGGVLAVRCRCCLADQGSETLISKRKSKGLMVGERCEIAALQEITEMSHCSRSKALYFL